MLDGSELESIGSVDDLRIAGGSVVLGEVDKEKIKKAVTEYKSAALIHKDLLARSSEASRQEHAAMNQKHETERKLLELVESTPGLPLNGVLLVMDCWFRYDIPTGQIRTIDIIEIK